MPERHLKTSKYGEITYQDRDIFRFPEGLLGLPDLHTFVLMEKDERFDILQSVDNPDISFTVTEPAVLDLHMNFKMMEDDANKIHLKDKQDLWILDIVNIPEDHPEKMSVNIAEPICINYKNHIGIQESIHAPSSYDLDHCLDICTDDGKHLIGAHGK